MVVGGQLVSLLDGHLFSLVIVPHYSDHISEPVSLTYKPLLGQIYRYWVLAMRNS